MFPFTYNICHKLFHYFNCGYVYVCAVCYISTLLEEELQIHLAYEIQFIYNQFHTALQ